MSKLLFFYLGGGGRKLNPLKLGSHILLWNLGSSLYEILFEDIYIKFVCNLDEIVPDGSKNVVPCNAEPLETAPPGSYHCNSTVAICLEKWQVSTTYFFNVLILILLFVKYIPLKLGFALNK